jgi:hypothetical protein
VGENAFAGGGAEGVTSLVSCIMPTANRRHFVPEAIACFLRQDYASCELLILDDGAEAVEDLVPDEPRVRYVRCEPGLTLGGKRNRACELAAGEIIAHWDDDDWYPPNRLSRQVIALIDRDADVCGSSRLYYRDTDRTRAWEYAYQRPGRPWVAGNTLAYRRVAWERTRFRDVRVGEDSHFVWRHAGSRVVDLADPRLCVGTIHPGNTSPKRPAGTYWKSVASDLVERIVATGLEPSPAVTPARSARPLRNLFVCLVHESPECVVDVVRNLRYLDPTSTVLLYDGGRDPGLLARGLPLAREGVVVHPAPRPMRWGALHPFALDCMRFAQESFAFDTLTVVDSDQLGVRPGYSDRLAEFLAARENVGLLGNSPGLQPRGTRVAPAATAWQEVELWRPFLRRFPEGEAKWVHWSFWPSTVITADACRALVDLFDHDAELQRILAASKLWATEEVLFPTLVALLGFRVLQNPASADYVRYQARYTRAQLQVALKREDVFWVHPVPRRYDDPLRRMVRDRFRHYDREDTIMTPAAAPTELFLTLPILARMKGVEGWLEEDEADLLIAATRATCPGGAPLGAIVEVGSYCGRSTVVIASAARAFGRGARVHAVDPHDGRVGAADQGIRAGAPTLQRFRHNIAAAGLSDMVEVVPKHSWEVQWEGPIGLLFIDGLHDYTNVARDFHHFLPWLAPGAYVAFHDYADYYPGVKAFVHELLDRGDFESVQCVRSLMLVRRVAGGATPDGAARFQAVRPPSESAP